MTSWLLAGVLGVALGASPGESRGAAWLTDYEQARAEARRTGKPILLIFR
jgi:hypothetical protein